MLLAEEVDSVDFLGASNPEAAGDENLWED
jgi:hypothetical protein